MKDWTGTGTSTFKTIGASNHTEKERERHDYYATEPKVAELLCDLFQFSPLIWECACGEGHLARVFEDRGYIVKATDLIDRGYGKGGVDFLKCTKPFAGDIITNPPYKYAQQFVEKALELVEEGHHVAMFLKLTFMEGKGRKELFQNSPPCAFIFQVLGSYAPRTESSRKCVTVGVPLLRMAGTSGKRATTATRP